MSFLARVWKAIRNPVRYVGRDLEGNRFYEQPITAGLARPKRTVDYRDSEEVWQYIGGNKRLPIQWSAWLSHTRAEPPTVEELQSDLQRQLRVRYNASLIEARDRAESKEMARIQAETHAELLRAPLRSQEDRSNMRTSEEPRTQDADVASYSNPLQSATPGPGENAAAQDPWNVPTEPTKPWAPTLRKRGE